jgi:hypothetical protein
MRSGCSRHAQRWLGLSIVSRAGARARPRSAVLGFCPACGWTSSLVQGASERPVAADFFSCRGPTGEGGARRSVVLREFGNQSPRVGAARGPVSCATAVSQRCVRCRAVRTSRYWVLLSGGALPSLVDGRVRRTTARNIGGGVRCQNFPEGAGRRPVGARLHLLGGGYWRKLQFPLGSTAGCGVEVLGAHPLSGTHGSQGIFFFVEQEITLDDWVGLCQSGAHR